MASLPTLSRIALNCQLEVRVGKNDSGYFGQLFTRQRAERVLAGVEEHIRQVHDEAASGIASRKDGVELLQQFGAKFFTIKHGLLELLHRNCSSGFVSFRFRFRVSLALLSIRRGFIGVSSGRAIAP